MYFCAGVSLSSHSFTLYTEQIPSDVSFISNSGGYIKGRKSVIMLLLNE